MMKLDLPPRDDMTLDCGRSLPLPFLAQGIRDALRNAYGSRNDAVPAEFMSLLAKLR